MQIVFAAFLTQAATFDFAGRLIQGRGVALAKSFVHAFLIVIATVKLHAATIGSAPSINTCPLLSLELYQSNKLTIGISVHSITRLCYW